MIEELNLVEMATNLRVQLEKLKDKRSKGEDVPISSIKAVENRISYYESKMSVDQFKQYGIETGYLE